MSTQPATADVITVLEENLQGIDTQHNLNSESIVRKVYGELNVRMHWIEENELNKNIIGWVDEDTARVTVETNAWLDELRNQDVVRQWDQDDSITPVSLTSSQYLDQIEKAIDDAYSKSQQFTSKGDLSKTKTLVLTQGEKKVLGY